jgi:hypothetical protein
LENILSAVSGIKAIAEFPSGLAEQQLDDAQCAALNLCRAIIDYVIIVIRYLKSGFAGWFTIFHFGSSNCCIRNFL